MEYLHTKQETLEAIVSKTTELNQQKTHQGKDFKRQLKTFATSVGISCTNCNGDHFIRNCESFLKLEIPERSKLIKSLKLCLNCLRKGHFVGDCKSSACKLCDRKHNTLLHIKTSKANAKIEHSQQSNIETTTTCSTMVEKCTISQVLLSTANVNVVSSRNKTINLRVLLDSASQANFITENACNILNQKREPINISITGINQSTCSMIQHQTYVTIASQHNNFSTTVKCLIIPKIANMLPISAVNIKNLEVPSHIKLADATFNRPGQIDMLLGADIFYKLLCTGQICKPGEPTYQKTKLGWVVSGNASNVKNNQTSTFLSLQQLHTELQQFWKVDEYCTNCNHFTEEEQFCETFFKDTTTRGKDGKFIVRIPFKSNLSQLGNSLNIAQARFNMLERRFVKNPKLKETYTDFIDEYIKLNHMTLNDINEINSFHLPHHAVINSSKETTKLRVVFDGSCPPDTGISVNKTQCVGPTIQQDIISIIARFRIHEYVLTADIEKMYRQVWIHPEDRKYQKILWRSNKNDNIHSYDLNTITYGTSAAPHLAIRCLFEIASQINNSNPVESLILKQDFYVDDLLTGSNSVQSLQDIKSNLTSILSSYGFPLRKWKSNINICDEITPNNNVCISSQTNKTLGVFWNPKEDLFTYTIIDVKNKTEVTKRSILSSTAQLFDPLGLLAPVILIAKLIIQELWQLKISWDESVPLNIHTKWVKFNDEMKYIKSVTIPRLCLIPKYTYLELHGFADSSETSYGACIYIKSVTLHGKCEIHLLAAKSRVAPIKKISLPRLELLAAVLLVELTHKLKLNLKLSFDKEYYWSDSQIVLCWLRSCPSRWVTFVANRVTRIQELSNITDWHHVRSSENPADIVSRGCNTSQLLTLPIWWHGPHWLKGHHNKYPNSNVQLSKNDIPDTKVVCTLHTTTHNSFPFQSFSNLLRLTRTAAYCLRFIANCSKKTLDRNVASLTNKEVTSALMRLIKIAQIESFSDDYQRLNQKRPLDPKSRILSLTPFIDTEGLIRVGGRLEHSTFSFGKKHPILLPAKHKLTSLFFEQEHKRLLHPGPNLLLSSIRQTFWPILGRNLARKTVRNCVKCFRFNPITQRQLMGDLPTERLTVMPPFHAVGVDYAGPLMIKNNGGKKAILSKCYICIFVCLTTKSIHIEPITSLTTDAFISAFRRFIARRGKPLHVYSDNATNFVGANKELKQLYQFIRENSNSIDEQMNNEGINWHFIPAHAPNFGGLWEAGIKSIKYHLKRVMYNASLTFEELFTILVQIESILNSRPLTQLSTDPNDLEVLTPAHFLIGRTFTSLPDPDVRDIKLNRLDRYQYLQRLNQQFWNRWSKDYLNSLQQRTKWKQTSKNIEIGAIVLIKEDNLPPFKWMLGRITGVQPGQDGIIRVVTIKCASGVLKRAISKLCILPMETRDI